MLNRTMMKQFVVDGQAMAYRDLGQGEVIVFGHHYLWDGLIWQEQVAKLSQEYRCIVPDFWSHGQSQSAPQSMRSLRDYAQHIVALMDELNIVEFSIVGAGAAGMWGSEVVALVPQRVKKLALINSFIGLEPEVAHSKYTAMLNRAIEEKQLAAETIDALTAIYFSNNSLDGSQAAIERFKQNLAQIVGQTAQDLAMIGKMIIGRRDLCEIAENFALPTLICAGCEDRVRTGLESYLMNDLISGSELHLIERVGHMSMLEAPDKVTERLLAFFA